MAKAFIELATRNGVQIVPGKISASSLLVDAVEKSGVNRRFSGTLPMLEVLTSHHMDQWVPGIGSVDGDVRIVELPTEGFFTDIVRITEDNKHLLETVYSARQEGEEEVPTLILRGVEPEEAAKVGVVIYRADVLDRDNGRSSNAEWEIVAILADPLLVDRDSVPMHPATMSRNSAHLVGGTLREYTPDQWVESVLFWQRHARAVPVSSDIVSM